MGYISLTVVASFTLLVAYSVLISGAEAKSTNQDMTSQSSQNSNEFIQKRPVPAAWLKAYPIRRMKPLNTYSVYRRDLLPADVEFVDDSINDIEKRFDDYGHLR